MEGTRVSGQRMGLGAKRFWQLAVFAATGTLGITSQTEAAIYYRQDSTPVVTEPTQARVGRAKPQRNGEKKSNVVEREAKPQGPLIISISISEQKLRVYDANGLFAESPVSTGMPGHPTPMGVFSIIQKQKFHRSNIYSGAPMPFMQRITWSGVAMHAGVLPGHPASHGCIRMPMAFAVKLYNWTKMSARVVITPGDVMPASFSHPLLASVKVVPQPVAVEETKADAVAVQMPEKPAQLDARSAPNAVEIKAADDKLELRSTVGHADSKKPAADANHPATSPEMKTADASGTLPATLSSRAIADGVSEHGPQSMQTPVSDDKMASDKQTASTTEAETEASAEVKPARDVSAETQPAKIADSETKPVDATAFQPAKPDKAAKPDAKPLEASASPSVLEAKPKADSEPEKPAGAAKAVAAVPMDASVATNSAALKADLKSDFAKTAASSPDLWPPLKKTEQIAVFVSRKDSKLYVRQNFSPLFNVPVTIAADDRPLGTHIFTAQVDKNDANALHWSVVSLPVPAKAANRRAEEERGTRHSRKTASASAIESKTLPMPDNAAEALDRLSLPAQVMAKIYEAVSTGGSIIISDQGIAAGETGEGTDFIVSLR